MNDRNEEPSLPDPGVPVKRSHLDFPVVGLGASAGGLQAALRFFEHLPNDTGMAFVLILHLAPQHESSADKIVQTATKMPVIQVTQDTPIRANHVYIISPALHLEMTDGHLRVQPQTRPRGRQIAIDVFFRTLADAHQAHGIAIILSGTGSDGSAGISRVKEQGGVTIAQSPDDAEYDGMPENALATGNVDLVLPVVEIPQKLIDLWKNAQAIRLPESLEDLPAQTTKSNKETQAADQALREILISLRTRTGHDFRQYKHATVLRRIERRMQVNQLTTLPDYRDFLQNNPGEAQALLGDMLISVTNFFRDREAFEALEREVVPKLIKAQGPDEQLRIWVCGCATGEEAYSLAMLVSEATENDNYDMQIFGTDIDERAVGMARAGAYPEAIVMEVPPTRLRRFFQREDNRYLVKKAIREKVLFAIHNVLRDPPFSKVHMISCRNLLIYLSREVQQEILQMFHFALRPGGFLFLGSSESTDVTGDLFSPVDKKARIFRANPVSTSRLHTPTLPLGDFDYRAPAIARSSANNKSDSKRVSFAELHQRVLEQYAPPSVIVNRESQIMHMSNRAGAYLRFIGGEPSNDLVEVVLPELRLELRTALYKSIQANKSVEARRVQISRDERHSYVNMIVRPFRDADADMDFILVLFDEVEDTMRADAAASDDGKDPALRQLEAELRDTKEDLQNTIEQSESSMEELKASNEELQAINEELRSTTEELETSKEELQSMNEELITVNFELKNKVDELGKANDDMQNLMASTDLANIFVDRSLNIKRFTPGTSRIFNLLSSDIGRSLLDITHRLDYPELAADAAAAFVSLSRIDREVRSNDDRWYIVRLVPYRTAEDRIEGTVLTFIDITERRQAQDQVLAGEEHMRLIAANIKDYAIITSNPAGVITTWNEGAEHIFGWTEKEAVGESGAMIFTPEDRERGAVEQEMSTAREHGRAEDERWHVRRDGSRFYCSGIMHPLYREAGELHGYVKIARDWTDRKREEDYKEALIRQEQLTVAAVEAENRMKDEFLAVMSHELKNPLNLIQITAEVLARLPDLRGSQQSQRAIKTIQRSVQSQARIIDDLLDLSRVHTGKLMLELAEVDLAALINTLTTMNDDEGSSLPEITVSETDRPLLIQADPVRVEQIVGNLLSNAVKFTGAYGSIDVSLKEEDGCARIDIRDTGEGIAPHILPRIFDMFGQGDNYSTRSKGGLGIGLSLVRQLAEAHGGRVAAESDGPGKGAHFTVWLPIRNPHEMSQPLAIPHTSIFTGLNILLVDDEEEMLDAFRELLSLEGASVMTSQSAGEALKLCEMTAFDLVLSDIGMPRMDGYEFVRWLRGMPKFKDVPVLALTGFGRPVDIKRAQAAGFSAHLSKPVALKSLVKAFMDLQQVQG
jgi:two-component system, chemotaxis family, CheB/CheR fusion protein